MASRSHLAVRASHASSHVVPAHTASLDIGQHPEVARAALRLVAFPEVRVHREVVANTVLPTIVARLVEPEVAPVKQAQTNRTR